MTRRDHSPATPPFTLTTDQVRLCHEQAVLGWLDATLEQMHRQHCHDYRPVRGVANSLNTLGDLAFDAAWTANREQHMAEAYAAWDRANAVELGLAA